MITSSSDQEHEGYKWCTERGGWTKVKDGERVYTSLALANEKQTALCDYRRQGPSLPADRFWSTPLRASTIMILLLRSRTRTLQDHSCKPCSQADHQRATRARRGKHFSQYPHPHAAPPQASLPKSSPLSYLGCNSKHQPDAWPNRLLVGELCLSSRAHHLSQPSWYEIAPTAWYQYLYIYIYIYIYIYMKDSSPLSAIMIRQYKPHRHRQG